MTPEEHLNAILLSTKLGPLTPCYGLVGGVCECGERRTEYWIRDKAGKLKKRHYIPGKHARYAGWQNEVLPGNTRRSINGSASFRTEALRSSGQLIDPPWCRPQTSLS